MSQAGDWVDQPPPLKKKKDIRLYVINIISCSHVSLLKISQSFDLSFLNPSKSHFMIPL